MTVGRTPRYSIIFDGELVRGVSREAALGKLAQLTNLSEDELLDCLFSVKPVIAAQADNYQLADEFKAQFRLAGLEVSTQAYTQSHDDMANAALNFGHYAPLETQELKPNFFLNTSGSSSPPKSDIYQKNGKYRVTFNGSLLDGYDRKQVMKNLCSLTNRSEEDVLENIFSAVPVIICQTDEIELAQAYHHGFEQAGLKVYFLADGWLPNTDDLPRSYLLMRDDKPSPLPEKKIQRFTFALYGLAGLACLCWVLIYMAIDSYLKEDTEEPLQVQLVQYKTEAKTTTPPAPAAVKENNTSKKLQPIKEAKIAENPPALKQTVKVAQEQQRETKSPAQPEKTVPAANESETLVKKKDDKIQQMLKGEYNLQLLNWFAQFQQHNPLESKYVEGEIKLRLTISRGGKIKNIEVLKSTSEELQRIIVMQLRKARSVPGIPIKITGSEYLFDLPLRYRFE